MDCKSPKNCQPDDEPPKGIKIRCPVCKYRKFRSEQAFCDHIQDQHNLFPCMNCDAIFACKDDLVQHRNEKHPKAPSKLTHNRKTKGKLRPVIRKVSLPASENIPSTQPLLRLRPPTRARLPVAHARQPSTKTRKPPAPIRRQSTMQPRQSSGWPNQGNKLGHPAHAQVFRPSHSSIFHSQHQLHQIRHPLPPRPVKIYRGPSHGFRMPSRDFLPAAQSFHLAGQVTQVPLGFYKASDQVFQPVAVPGPPARFYHPRATSYETPTPPYYASSPVYQSPPRDQNQMVNYRAASEGRRTPTPVRQTHPRRMKNKIHVYRAPPQATQFPKENLQSSQEFADSNFFNQESQHQEPQQVEQVFRVPVRSPARDSPSPEQYSQEAKEVARFPHLDSQPPQRSQSSEWNSQDSEIPQSLEGSKSPEQANNQAEQVSQSFSQISQHLEPDHPLEPSQFLRQVFQEAEKVTQSRQKHSQSLENFPFLIYHYEQAESETNSQSTQFHQFAMPILEKTDQVSHNSLHLSAHDPVTAEANESDRATTSTPATNITTPSLSNPPLPRNRTFSLVYGTMPHRWTNLEPLEQTLILRYLLATCHTPKRLHSQGYNAPKTTKTESCENNGQPHQQHLDPLPTDANTTHRKAIVLDCKMIETTTCTSELAFITAIDFLTGEVLINSYVTPTAPVTNWLTPVSGITQEKMDAAIAEGNVLVSNADARGALRKFLNRDTVLIGHTLQHALRTLSLIHGRIVDTSVVTGEAVFSNAASKTTLPRIWGLETLARELVGIQIRGGDEGHSSLEDALATREILIWCLRGPQCLKAWAEKTRVSLYRRNRRGARGNRGNEGGGANANNGQENTSG